MMFPRIRGLRPAGAALLAALCVLALGACGSSGSDRAGSLLKQTFRASHTVNSGRLDVKVSIDPHGSTVLTQPITLGFAGPFESRGKGQLPASDFSLNVSANGHTGSLGILSTGTAGYVSLSGTSYQLPAAAFQKLDSSFSSAAPGAGAGSGALAKLGIDPLRWLVQPTVLGSEQVAGSATTHIRAGIDVANLLKDLTTLLSKASSAGVGTAAKLANLTPAQRQQAAREVKNARVDVWTGSSDKTLRRLAISLTLPVKGTVSSQLGGLSSATIAVTLQYSEINQPQTITPPRQVAPYSQFAARITQLLQAVQSSVASGAG